ncbi:hypothetical protein MKW98_030112 [Papaver atlanticum]|uniref:Pectinesterase n=1 Tax=Papaver atlanticum TaxID=357466 RepID=A0AAD4T562_9MAGN|nr:hypothetical protein MKW98_030112 [Papaver atlanticum]
MSISSSVWSHSISISILLAMFKPNSSIILIIFLSLLITTAARPATLSPSSPSPPQGLQQILSRNGARSTTQEWRFLNMSLASMEPDIVVSGDGSGTFRTITEAINAVPDRSSMRTVIYIKAGTYEEENLEVGSQKTNVVIIGDGIGKTVITGRKNVKDDNVNTYHTASFAATGAGFMATKITFENRAGPHKDQAVALRVSSARAVFYRCSFLGYQDTLYVHRNVQFFRECDIYGTIDFIFGDSRVVIQKSNIYARTPLVGHPNIITAQKRGKSTDNTGIIIHDSRILPAPEYVQFKKVVETYLGRPWGNYSQVVYMCCWMDDHINPQGWIPWSTVPNDTVPDTLFYGEFNNSGPGASVVPRVNWTGNHRITALEEVQRFTVTQFILGSVLFLLEELKSVNLIYKLPKLSGGYGLHLECLESWGNLEAWFRLNLKFLREGKRSWCDLEVWVWNLWKRRRYKRAWTTAKMLSHNHQPHAGKLIDKMPQRENG